MGDPLGRSHYPGIGAYGVVGDLHTVALIDDHGSIDWLCIPFLDSASVFARILDVHQGGSFAAVPQALDRTEHQYLSGTNILRSTFHTRSGIATTTDFMPVLTPDGSREDLETGYICRRLECQQGIVTFDICLDPRPNYGLSKADSPDRASESGGLSSDLRFAANREISWDHSGLRSTIQLAAGESLDLVIGFGQADLPTDLSTWFDAALYRTEDFWLRWLSRCHYRGPWRSEVERAALTLKLLTFKPTGALAAAPTTSLPEEIGGERNWDYRFSWIRDSALTLNALMVLGFTEEAKDFFNWLVNHAGVQPHDIQALYPLRTGTATQEIRLEHWEGYKQSRPVRTGNGAAKQFQLDVYGEILETIYLFGVFGEPLTDAHYRLVQGLANSISARWQEPDEGIWEVRSGRAHFTHSKVMCAVGLDRAVRLAEERGALNDAARWRDALDSVTEFIYDHCVDPETGALQQSKEQVAPDAATLLASLLHFCPPDSDLMLHTLDAIDNELCENNYVDRYRAQDGLAGGEGAFVICGFWFAEALAMAGRSARAREVFEHHVNLANDLGLLAEEAERINGSALGNFPQAFSHIGLINAALALDSPATSLRPGTPRAGTAS